MRKKIFVFISMLTLTAVLFTSCKKYDENDNYLDIGGFSFALDWGYCELMDVYDTQGNFCVCLCDSRMSYSSSTGLTGTGSYIWLELFSSSIQKITSGNYTFDDDTYPDFTFTDYSYWEMNNYLTGYMESYLVDGSIDVVNNGDNEYEITLNCEDEDGNTIKGHYKGTLGFYNSSGRKSAAVSHSANDQ